jgi:hypothetical protein
MSFELDHMFVAASPGAPEMRMLSSAGFQEGPEHDHPGQGTASRGVFFENAYLELIWLTDRAIASTAAIRRTHLVERADPEHPACSFGIGLRSPAEPVPPAPFETWAYRPPYLPEGAALQIGTNSGELDEPLLFVLPWSRGASWELPAHPNGTRRITRVTVVSAGGKRSADLEAFSGMGLVSVEEGEAPFLRLELDDGSRGRQLDLRPSVPLLIRW